VKRLYLGFFALAIFAFLTGCVSTEPSVKVNIEAKTSVDDGITSINYKEISYSEIESTIKESVNSSTWTGVIVNVLVKAGSSSMYQDFLKISDKPSEGFTNYYTSHDSYGKFKYQNLTADKFQNVISKLDKNKLYKVYIAVFQGNGYITKVDGILTDAEVEEVKTALLKAEEEANKYDPKEFAYYIDGFKPAKYKAIDLFTAVAQVEKMPRGDGSIDLFGLVTKYYVSNIVFISQNGTDVRFKTTDNAISQYFKIGGRTGLNSGQIVRVYYCVTKNPIAEWLIEAVEFSKGAK